MQETEVYRVLMDERWDLEDLYNFPQAFSQAHAFIYCLEFDLDERSSKRIDLSLIHI